MTSRRRARLPWPRKGTSWSSRHSCMMWAPLEPTNPNRGHQAKQKQTETFRSRLLWYPLRFARTIHSERARQMRAPHVIQKAFLRWTASPSSARGRGAFLEFLSSMASSAKPATMVRQSVDRFGALIRNRMHECVGSSMLFGCFVYCNFSTMPR